MNQIPDFSETELWVIRSAVDQRYGRHVELQMADTELRLEPSVTELTTCPAVFWAERGANFVVCKIGEGHYRSQFFYSIREQYGTGRETYDDLAECVTILLQVQSDHERDKGLQAGDHPADSG